MEWDWSAFFQFLEAVVGLFGTFASLLIGFVLGLVAALWEDWRKTRKRHRQIATGLVYEIRRTIDGLTERVKGMEATGAVAYTNEFQQGLFEQAQTDLVELGGSVFMNVSAFYAQLRNTNFLTTEFKQLESESRTGLGSGSTAQQLALGVSKNQAATTLLLCLKSGIKYGQDALDALKPHAEPVAFTTDLPVRFLTEHEKAALGLDPGGPDVPEGQAQP